MSGLLVRIKDGSDEPKLKNGALVLPVDVPLAEIKDQIIKHSNELPRSVNFLEHLFSNDYIILHSSLPTVLLEDRSILKNNTLLGDLLILEPVITYKQVIESLPLVEPRSDVQLEERLGRFKTIQLPADLNRVEPQPAKQLEERLKQMIQWLFVLDQLTSTLEETYSYRKFYTPLRPEKILIKTSSDTKVYLRYDGAVSSQSNAFASPRLRNIPIDKIESFSKDDVAYALGAILFLSLLNKEPELLSLNADLKLFREQTLNSFPELGNPLFEILIQALNPDSNERYSDWKGLVKDFFRLLHDWVEQRKIMHQALNLRVFNPSSQHLEIENHSEALKQFNKISIPHQVAWNLLGTIEDIETEFILTTSKDWFNSQIVRSEIYLAELRTHLSNLKAYTDEDGVVNTYLSHYSRRLDLLIRYGEAVQLQSFGSIMQLNQASQQFESITREEMSTRYSSLNDFYKDADFRTRALKWKIQYYQATQDVKRLKQYPQLIATIQTLKLLQENLQKFDNGTLGYLDKDKINQDVERYIKYLTAKSKVVSSDLASLNQAIRIFSHKDLDDFLDSQVWVRRIKLKIFFRKLLRKQNL
jgi:hypothetical protein